MFFARFHRMQAGIFPFTRGKIPRTRSLMNETHIHLGIDGTKCLPSPPFSHPALVTGGHPRRVLTAWGEALFFFFEKLFFMVDSWKVPQSVMQKSTHTIFLPESTHD